MYTGRGLTARKCGAGACVRIERTQTSVFIEDTKEDSLLGGRTIIEMSANEFDHLQQQLANAPSVATGRFVVCNQLNGWFALTDTSSGKTLRFDSGEWSAFVTGIQQGDFAVERFMTLS